MSAPSAINIFLPTHIFNATTRGFRSGLLFGYHAVNVVSGIVNFNITALLPYESIHQLDQLLFHLQQHNDHEDTSHTGGGHWDQQQGKSTIHFLGELRDDSNENDHHRAVVGEDKLTEYNLKVAKLRHCYRHFQLVLSYDSPDAALSECAVLNEDRMLEDRRIYSTISLTSVKCFEKSVSNYSKVMMVYYDTRNFMSSQLLNRFNVDDNRVEFVDFINDTLKNTAQLFCDLQYKELPPSMVSSVGPHHHHHHSHHAQHPHHHESSSSPSSHYIESFSKDPTSAPDLAISALLMTRLVLLMPRRLIRAFVYFTSPQQSIQQLSAGVSTSRLGALLYTLATTVLWYVDCAPLRKSATLGQLKFRFLQFAICWRLLCEIPRRRISLSLGNVISSVVLDTLLGLATIIALHYYSTPTYWLEQAWKYADSMVEDVDRLLRLLQSMPAGLKLNRPLNMALSQFYLYHIYLWESYMDIIRPIFGVVMQAIFYCGLFGFTCILSLLSDIFSLVTIHIYCFYGYGCQLYDLQISGISALWRLFRGKKWNQLRSRVDSYSYDNEQLFIGTILFTVLLFLLPTVFMYYLVFLILRFMTLAVQEGLFFFIEHLSSMPLYSLFLWLCNSRTISGRVYFELISENSDDEIGPDDEDDDEVPNEGEEEEPNHIGNNVANNHNHVDFDAQLNRNNNMHNTVHSNCPVVVRLKTERVSLFKIISSRYDDMLQSLHAYRQTTSSAKELTWNEFFQSILTGKLLHQNISIGLSLLLFIGYLLVMVYFTFHSVSA